MIHLPTVLPRPAQNRRLLPRLLPRTATATATALVRILATIRTTATVLPRSCHALPLYCHSRWLYRGGSSGTLAVSRVTGASLVTVQRESRGETAAPIEALSRSHGIEASLVDVRVSRGDLRPQVVEAQGPTIPAWPIVSAVVSKVRPVRAIPGGWAPGLPARCRHGRRCGSASVWPPASHRGVRP